MLKTSHTPNIGKKQPLGIKELVRQYEEYLKSPEYDCDREIEAQGDRMADALKRLHNKSLKGAPKRMTLRDKPRWRKMVAAKADGCGGRLIRLAERWARLMESRIARGETVEECASKMFYLSNNEGLSNSKCEEAVLILSKVWLHGEELERWFHPPIQTKNEAKYKKADKHYGLLRPIRV